MVKQRQELTNEHKYSILNLISETLTHINSQKYAGTRWHAVDLGTHHNIGAKRPEGVMLNSCMQ